MTHVREVSSKDLDERRTAILARIGLRYDQLAARAAAKTLVGDEWAAWEEIREIDFLLGK